MKDTHEYQSEALVLAVTEPLLMRIDADAKLIAELRARVVALVVANKEAENEFIKENSRVRAVERIIAERDARIAEMDAVERRPYCANVTHRKCEFCARCLSGGTPPDNHIPRSGGTE